MYDMPPLKDCHHPSVRPSVTSDRPSVLSVRPSDRPIRPSDRPIMMPPPLSAGPMESPGLRIHETRRGSISFRTPQTAVFADW